MKKVFYILALSLLAFWFIGCFVLSAGTVIHVVLMISIVLYLQAIITPESFKPSNSVDEVELVTSPSE